MTLHALADIMGIEITDVVSKVAVAQCRGGYEYAQSKAYPIERIVEVADLAVSRDASAIGKLMNSGQQPIFCQAIFRPILVLSVHNKTATDKYIITDCPVY